MLGYAYELRAIMPKVINLERRLGMSKVVSIETKEGTSVLGDKTYDTTVVLDNGEIGRGNAGGFWAQGQGRVTKEDSVSHALKDANSKSNK